MAWDSTGDYLSSASFDGKTLIWELDHKTSQLEPLTCLQGHENEVKCAAWSHDGEYIATCGRDKSVWVWSITEDMEFEIVSVMQEHKQDVKSVRWHPTRALLASTSYDNSIKLWDYDASCDDWVCKQTLEGHTSTVWRADFSPEGDFMVSVGADGCAVLWKYAEAAYKQTAKVGLGCTQYSCAFSPVDPNIVLTVLMGMITMNL